jgi:uncharacterized protein (DUF2235 family)
LTPSAASANAAAHVSSAKVRIYRSVVRKIKDMTEAPAIAEATPKKKIALFLDGTWNAVDDNTNIWRLKSLCSPKSADGLPQLTYYEIGVNGFWGGVFGKGLDRNITDAYEWLIDQYNPGDEIFIFGFSRGAYTARSLAGLIAKCGLLKPGAALGVKQLYERYRRVDDRTIWTLIDDREKGELGNCTIEERWMLKYAMAVPIKFVGVWDTVGSLGIPILSIPGISRSTLGFLHTGLRLSIQNGYHALAIDEHRRAFAPTLWTVRKPDDPTAKIAAPRALSSVEQRWFAGAHANVGGGYDSDLLAQIPLRWIMKKASLHGFAFRNDVELDGDALKAPICDSYREFMGGAYRCFSFRYFRPVGEPPIRASDGTNSNVNETIDGSVFARWNHVAEYKPRNLADWAKRHRVDIARLKNSVLADDPKIAAPD